MAGFPVSLETTRCIEGQKEVVAQLRDKAPATLPRSTFSSLSTLAVRLYRRRRMAKIPTEIETKEADPPPSPAYCPASPTYEEGEPSFADYMFQLDGSVQSVDEDGFTVFIKPTKPRV